MLQVCIATGGVNSGGKAMLVTFGGSREFVSRAQVATSDWKYRKHRRMVPDVQVPSLNGAIGLKISYKFRSMLVGEERSASQIITRQ
jgi:hypothetical protein